MSAYVEQTDGVTVDTLGNPVLEDLLPQRRFLRTDYVRMMSVATSCVA